MSVYCSCSSSLLFIPISLIAFAAVEGQQPATSAATPPASAAPSGAATDAARKIEILSSECWRRAMFELSEWQRSQTVYSPEEIAQINAEFSARVEGMSADELRLVQADLEQKFRILNSPEAREVRAWLGNYLSLVTERRRDEILRMIPNIAQMNSTQLQQTIARLAQHRDSRAQQQARVRQLRGTPKDPWNQSAAAAPRPASRASYRSPYRPQSRERPFENVQTGPTRGMALDPYGRIWMNLGF